MNVTGKIVVPAIRVPELGLGPAMLKLNQAQRAFVFAKVIYGMSNTNAAKAAGYSASTRESLRSNAYRLAHDGNIQNAIQEETRKLMRAEGPRSVRTLITIRDNPKSEDKDRLKAAVELMNRGGLNAVSEHHVVVENLTDAQKDQRILALARELGLPDTEAQKLLIDRADVVDAEFTEVEPEPTPEQLARVERYHRLNENEKHNAREAMTPEELAAHREAVRKTRIAEGKARYQAAREDDLSDLLGPVTSEASNET
jgi:hypothetical protein